MRLRGGRGGEKLIRYYGGKGAMEKIVFKCLKGIGVISKPSKVSMKSWNRKLKKKSKKKKKKKRKIDKLQRMTYKEYIKSLTWKNRREKYYKTHKKECVVCKSKYKVGLHHLTYKRLKYERDEDLVVLCWACHGNYHEIHGHADYDTAMQYIIEEQERREFPIV